VKYSTAFDTEEEAEAFIKKVLGAISESGKADGILKLGTHAHPRLLGKNVVHAVDTLYCGSFGLVLIEEKEYKGHDFSCYHVKIET